MSDTGELSGAVTTSDNQGVHSQPAKFSARGWLWLALVFVLSALYMAQELKRGWVPPDEGTLAESAERVLHGELPHRDYHEGYTGGLAYLNAAAFQVFGTNLASMRYMLFLFFLTWVPAVYYVASRFVSAPVAGAVTLLAVAWGPPNYAAAMPSWYNLFFATFGLAALLRYIEVQTGRWLLVAGLCGGVSILFKLPGLYFVAGALLFLLLREQMAPSTTAPNRRESLWYRFFLLAIVLLYEALLFGLLRTVANIATYLYFWVPELTIGGAVFWHEFHAARNRSHRFYDLLRDLTLFGAGVAVPIAVFLVPYSLTGDVALLMRDMYAVSSGMIVQVNIRPSVQWFLEGSVVNLLLIGVVLITRSITAPTLWEVVLLGVPPALLIPSVLLLTHQAPGFYQLVWSTIWVLAPFVVMLGVGMLAHRARLDRLEPAQHQRLFLTLSVTAGCSLIQFPYTAPIYFCYIAPLVWLSATAVVSIM